jgi:hypothetical protein
MQVRRHVAGAQDNTDGGHNPISGWRQQKHSNQHGQDKTTKVPSWAPQEKATHLLTILQEQTTNFLHSIPEEAMYKEC